MEIVLVFTLRKTVVDVVTEIVKILLVQLLCSSCLHVSLDQSLILYSQTKQLKPPCGKHDAMGPVCCKQHSVLLICYCRLWNLWSLVYNLISDGENLSTLAMRDTLF